MATIEGWAPSGTSNVGKGPVNGTGGEKGYQALGFSATGNAHTVDARGWSQAGTFHSVSQPVPTFSTATGNYSNTATKNPNTQL